MANPKRTRSRSPLGTKLRYEVLLRHGFRCFYCGYPSSAATLEMDHVVPHSRGGSDRPWNLVPACWECNSGKGASAPTPAMVERARDVYFGDEDLENRDCSECGIPHRFTPNEMYATGGVCRTCLFGEN
ncbi:MAG: HNH endonuclease [Chitinophagaceae bacterium]|nr:HNH endonuclease [Rubrivivax sp.]